jgi:dipeptidyl aminopeptidase/acylaminoacyl peptidase
MAWKLRSHLVYAKVAFGVASVTVGLLACLLATAPASQATYPGRNGSIAFNASQIVNGLEVVRTDVIRPDGSGRRELGRFWFPSWSASGRRLFAIEYPIDYRSGELAHLVFADRLGRLRGEVPLPDSMPCGWPGCESYGPALVPRALFGAAAPSPDGRMVVFVQQVVSHLDRASSGTEIPWLWAVRTDGSGLRRLVRGYQPHWTPDGRRIVFQRIGPYGQHNSIASMRPDGTGFRRVHPSAGDDELRDLSPDGRRILWWGDIRRRGEARFGLYTSAVRGGDVRLVHGSRLPYPHNSASWSPDGSKIVFSREGPGRATWIVPAAGGQLRRLLSRPYQGLAWQPLPGAAADASAEPR